MMRRLLALPVLIALAGGRADAQRFVGAVQLPGGAGPAAGVLVTAVDSARRTVAETITLDDGSFAIFVDSTATVALRLTRPGTPAVEVARRRLGDGQVDTIRHTLAAAAPTLAGAIDRGSSTCRDRRTGTEPVHLLLEEARVTMRIAQLRVGREDAAARFVSFNHRTAKNGEDTLYTLMRREQGALPAVFEPVSTQQLEAGGFFGTVAGERVFRAPDLELLVSDWFHETHCFTLRRVTADSLVLAFAPTRERKGLVDIEGEYVFDRRSLDLREVTYRYQGLPSHERQSGAGGRIAFARAPNGNRFAAEWHQRVPILGYRQADGTTTFVRSEMTLIDITGHRTVGGRVLATLFRGRPTWQRDALVRPASATPFGQLCSERIVTAATGAVRGRLVSDSGAALQGVLVKASWHVNVVVDRTQMAQREQVREAVTDAEGRWVLCDIPVKRDVTVRYEVRGEERSIPVTLEEPMALLELPGAAAAPDTGRTLGVVTYNIRHGRGMDERVDLARTAGVLRALAPDLVGLQEVDERVTRSGGVDEAAALGEALGFAHAFGAFMDYQGGRYGMAILSRFPIVRATPLRLPDGNEPRVALVAEVRLPDGRALAVVNVHFDWVADDGFRHAQAVRLAAHLDSLTIPYVLLGDFNDEPGSRTLALFRARAAEAEKPADGRFTYPSVRPEKEIDFIFAAPRDAWRAGPARVVAELAASDHRPVAATLVLR